MYPIIRLTCPLIGYTPLLAVDWYKDENTTLKLKSTVEDSLNEDLPLSYNKEIFQSKTNLLMSMLIDKAVQGMRVA